MLTGIDLEFLLLRHGEFARWEACGVDVGDVDGRLLILGRVDDAEGDKAIDAHGGGEHVEEGVVDVFADDVDAAGGTCDELRGDAVGGFEGGEQGRPAGLGRAVHGGDRGVDRVDVGDVPGMRHELGGGRHGDGGSSDGIRLRTRQAG